MVGCLLRPQMHFIKRLSYLCSDGAFAMKSALTRRLHPIVTILTLAFALTAVGNSVAQVADAQTRQPLPEGAQGLAARYPGDAGIEKDPHVFFVERFDAGTPKDLKSRWETVVDVDGMAFVEDAPAGAADRQSLKIRHVGGQGTGSQLYRRLPPGHNQVFARFYVKFDAECAPIHHFGTHLGGFNPSTPWPQGGAGIRPDGAKRFTTGVEPFGEDWSWDFYSYWQGMRMHGDGNYWGTPFLAGGSRPPVKKDEWICVEMMVRINDPVSETNGEQAFWIDGKLWRRDGQVVSHAGPGFPRGHWAGGWWNPDAQASTAFEGIQWRSSDALTINYLWTYVYITKAKPGHVSEVWFDNIVVADQYIGPLAAVPSEGS